MNKEPIENARDPDLRLSKQALIRAARRAYEIAARTGTAIVVKRNGVLEKIRPTPAEAADILRQPLPRYEKDK